MTIRKCQCGAVCDRTEHVALHREIESFECKLCGTKAMVDRVRSGHDGQYDRRAGVCLQEDPSGQGQLRYAQADSGRDDRIRPLRMAASKSK